MHVRRLCESTMNGGYGYTPQQVGELTLDQVFMLLVDKDNLRSGPHAIKQISGVEALDYARDGKMQGRTDTGEVITARVVGKSLCARLNEEAKAREEAERAAALAAAKPKKRRKGTFEKEA